MHYVNLKQAIQKLETELLFLKDVNIRDWNVLSLKGMVFGIVAAKILYTKQKESRKLYLHTAIKFTYSLALTWKVEHEGGSFLKLA